MQIQRKWFSFGLGRKSSVFTSRYGNMNTTVTEAVSMPGRRSLDKSPGSPLLDKQHGTMGNGAAGGAVDIHAGSSSPKLEKVNEKDESIVMKPNKDYNDNKESDSGTNSPLIEHHRKSSKTTEV